RLSDGGNMYVELQAGLFEDQETSAFLQPQHSQQFVEYRIPYRDLSGLTRATPDAVLFARAEGGQLNLEVGGTRPIPGAKIRIMSGNKVVQEITANLDPRTVWKQKIQLNSEQSPRILVLDADGRTLLEHHIGGGFDADSLKGLKPGPQKQAGPDASQREAILFHQ